MKRAEYGNRISELRDKVCGKKWMNKWSKDEKQILGTILSFETMGRNDNWLSRKVCAMLVKNRMRTGQRGRRNEKTTVNVNESGRSPARQLVENERRDPLEISRYAGGLRSEFEGKQCEMEMVRCPGGPPSCPVFWWSEKECKTQRDAANWAESTRRVVRRVETN